MSLNQFYNICYIFIIVSISFGKVLSPRLSFDSPELIERNGKYKKYYELNKDGVEYFIKGPAEIKIYSKAAFPKKTDKEPKQFSFSISINNIQTISNNLENLDYSSFSSLHPRHVYTYSGKDVLVVPGGEYIVKISKNSIFSPPILVRVIRSGRKSKNILKEELVFSNYLSSQQVINNIKNTLTPAYYLLDESKPLFLQNSSDLLEFNFRGLHYGVFDPSKIITMNLIKNGRYDAKYHILSIPHPSKTIDAIDRVPSKLNKIYIKQSDGSNYLFQLEKSELLVRANRMLR